MKEEIEAPKIEVSNEEIANLSDAQLKTLGISMLTEMIEYRYMIEEKVKAMKSEIYREPTVKGRKLGLESPIWSRSKKINIQLEQNEETRIQKK